MTIVDWWYTELVRGDIRRKPFVVGWCPAGYEKFWPIPTGCTTSKQMEKENQEATRSMLNIVVNLLKLCVCMDVCDL